MQAKRVVLVAMAATIMLGLGGCPWLQGDSSDLNLLQVSGGRAYFQHYDKWSGFVTLPSTIWEVDLATEEATRVAEAGVRYDTQANGDYFASEQPTEDNQGSRVVATRISTGDEIVVLERDIRLGGRYDRVFALVDDRIVARTDDGLLVYDLSAGQVERTIAVPHSLMELLAANDQWALVSRNKFLMSYLLVNLTTEEAVAVPEIPSGKGLFFDAVIVDDYLFTGGSENEDTTVTRHTVQALHIPTLKWSTLADYGKSNSNALLPVRVLVRGANATHVLAEHHHHGVTSVEWIERDTGDHQQLNSLSNPFGSAVTHLQLQGEAVHWLSGKSAEPVLVTYDLATGQTETTPVNVPN